MDKELQRAQDIINIVIGQRDQALNALAQVQAQVLALQREIAALQENAD